MLRLLFVALILLIGGIAAVRSRFGALLLYVWFALFRPQEWVWVDITSLRLSTVLGVLVVVPCLLSGIWPVVAHPLSLGAIGFLSAALVAQHGAVNQELGWYWIDFMWKLILVTLLAARLMSSRNRVVAFVTVIVASFGFHAAQAGLNSVLQGGTRYFEGIGGAFIDNNAYAVGCVMILPFLVVLAQNATTGWKWAAACAVPLTIVTIIGTFSRSGLLALTAATLTFILLQKRRGLLIALAAIVLPLILLLSLPSGYADRMTTIATYEQVGDTSALGRLHFWRVALNIAADRPLGIGLWNFESVYDNYDFSGGQYGHERAVHNSHLQVLTETGWFGGVVWVWLFFSAFRICLAVRRRSASDETAEASWMAGLASASLASMTGFVVGGSFVSMALNDLTWLTFGIVTSLDRLSRDAAAQRIESATSGASETHAFAQ